MAEIERQQVRWSSVLIVLGLVVGGATLIGVVQGHHKAAQVGSAAVGDGAVQLDGAGQAACSDFDNWYNDWAAGALTNDEARVKIERIRARDDDTSNSDLSDALLQLQSDLTGDSGAVFAQVGVVRGICT